jgi:hypothetical protein
LIKSPQPLFSKEGLESGNKIPPLKKGDLRGIFYIAQLAISFNERARPFL